MRKLLLPVVLLLASIAGYLWFNPQNDEAALQTDQELLPDYIALNITRRLYNTDGYQADVVSAQRLEHFEQLGFMQFEKPVYTLYNEQHQPDWQASSEYAVWFVQDKVILEQQVRIKSLSQEQLFDSLETESLEMLFPDNRLQNNLPVLISGKGFEIKGVGINADLINRSFKLLQHHETVYLNEQ